MKISELLEKKTMTIADATDGIAGINRPKAEKILDPRGFFAKNKRKIHKDIKYPSN